MSLETSFSEILQRFGPNKNSDLSNMYSENIIHDYEDHGNMYSKELLNFFASQNIE